jgi:proline dehydrogenase
VVHRLQSEGMKTYVIPLGESVVDRRGISAAVETYQGLIPEIAHRATGTTLSIKLTQVGLMLEPGLAFRNARDIIASAAEYSMFVRLDMEESAHVDATLDIYRKLLSEGLTNTGVVLQAYLYRSISDLVSLLPMGPNIRLVKGAYLEGSAVAYQRKWEVDQNYRTLIHTSLQHGRFSAIATHDHNAIRYALAVMEGSSNRGDVATFEFQMLYGIRAALQRSLVAGGRPLRICVPFGTDWFVYFSRRLAERPANVLFLVKNLLRP